MPKQPLELWVPSGASGEPSLCSEVGVRTRMWGANVQACADTHARAHTCAEPRASAGRKARQPSRSRSAFCPPGTSSNASESGNDEYRFGRSPGAERLLVNITLNLRTWLCIHVSSLVQQPGASCLVDALDRCYSQAVTVPSLGGEGWTQDWGAVAECQERGCFAYPYYSAHALSLGSPALLLLINNSLRVDLGLI